jgi:hypothetical protein
MQIGSNASHRNLTDTPLNLSIETLFTTALGLPGLRAG